MKIAHLCQPFPPMVSGAALVAQRLAAGMVRRGHHVLVMAASDRGHAYQAVEAGVQVVRLRAYPNPARVGQRFVLWPGNAVLDRLRAFAPDVIHLHDPLQVGLAGVIAGRLLGVPVVLTLHAMPGLAAAYAPALPGLRWAVATLAWGYGRWLSQFCRGVVVPSQVMAQLITDRTGLSAHVIGNGVDLERFTPQATASWEAKTLRAKLGLDPQLPVILYVGRLDMEKRVDVVIRAAAEVVRAGGAQLVLAGDGRQRHGLERLCARLGIAGGTVFTGFMDVDELPGLYRLASAFAIASEVETQGVAVLEAAASGLPVVTVRATAMPELVEDSVTGYLAAPGDYRAMGARLAELLGQPQCARRMGLAGRALMAQHHSYRRTLEQHDELYAPSGVRPRVFEREAVGVEE